ncbi:MAG: succinate dehydrogenase, hydrophobic membrane anchor protein [Pseudomonadota bacterium]
MNKVNLQSDIAKAKGLGSGHQGTAHFIHQRLTALALIPLVLWFCFSLVSLPNMDYNSIIQWIQMPINTVLLMLIVAAAFYHLQLGLQVVIEDYVSSYPIKLLSIILTNFACFFLAILGLYSILKISL